MTRSWIVLGLGGVLLAAVAAAVVSRAPAGVDGDAGPGADPRDPVTRAELDELRAALEFERHARTALAEQVAGLRRELADARTSARAAETSPSLQAAADADAEEAKTADEQADATASSAGAAGFDGAALVRAGLPDADAERLRARWEAFELEKLELNNQGLREGWKGKRFRQEHRALETALRLELGDEWDAYLFATGRQNRLRVNNVLSDSLAAGAGFEEGDMILSYDRERVYHPGELRGKTAGCPEGGFAGVEVVRDGRLDTLRVPCGPLGVLVDHVKEPPRVE